MGIFNEFFSRKKTVYQSIFPYKVQGLNDRQKSQFDLIAMQYKRLSLEKPGNSQLQQAFFDRYDRARKEDMKMDDFFHVEEEALNIYKKKLELSSRNNQLDDKDNTRVGKKSWNIRSANKQLEEYPRVSIHVKANPKIERLYGALISFEKKFSSGLIRSTKVITESEYQKIIYGVIYSLEDFVYSKKRSIPFIFSQYCFDLDKNSQNQSQLEKEIITKASIIFDKVKKIIHWSYRIDVDKFSNNLFSNFFVDKQSYDFHEFFNLLKEETDSLISAFNLYVSD